MYYEFGIYFECFAPLWVWRISKLMDARRLHFGVGCPLLHNFICQSRRYMALVWRHSWIHRVFVLVDRYANLDGWSFSFPYIYAIKIVTKIFWFLFDLYKNPKSIFPLRGNWWIHEACWADVPCWLGIESTNQVKSIPKHLGVGWRIVPLVYPDDKQMERGGIRKYRTSFNRTHDFRLWRTSDDSGPRLEWNILSIP